MDISDAVDDMFYRYPWPGNVRELEHTLKSSLSVIEGDNTIRRDHLSSYFTENYQRLVNGAANTDQPPPLLGSLSPQEGGATPTAISLVSTELAPFQSQDKFCLTTTVQRIEAIYIEQALRKAGYNISKAGRFLNLSPQSMRYKIKKLGIEVPVE